MFEGMFFFTHRYRGFKPSGAWRSILLGFSLLRKLFNGSRGIS